VVILERLLNFRPQPISATEALQVAGRAVPLLLVQNPRARRYLLRLRPDGTVRVTIPRRGTASAARDFAARNVGWLEQQLQRLAAQPQAPVIWQLGMPILFRGEPFCLEPESAGVVRFGPERVKVPVATADLRPAIQQHLRQRATRELPARLAELAARHGIVVNRISVRNQKSRWGSCSRRGTISLNWRLIQLPGWVCDYIILHELAHRRQMNHSEKFWQEVARLCPEYREAERWLRRNANLLK
jgi:hypothetical protein